MGDTRDEIYTTAIGGIIRSGRVGKLDNGSELEGELVYCGCTGDVVHAFYREWVNGQARPASGLNLRYNVSKLPTECSIFGELFLIHEATNVGIRVQFEGVGKP